MQEAMRSVNQWLVQRQTPLLWVCGPIGCGKTTVVEAEVQRAAASTVMLRLSAFGPDGAHARVSGEENKRLTTKLLLGLATDQHIIVLDSLDALQQTVGQRAGDITDCRLRQFLLAACRQTLPGAAIIVTSRIAPPSLLPRGSLTIVNLPQNDNVPTLSLPARGSLERRVLDFAALSRLAVDPQGIQRMSGISERVTRRVLSSAVKAGLVTRISPTSYQVPEWIRSSVLPDSAQTRAVRKLAIDSLRQSGADPERLLGVLVDDGNIGEAINVYWHSLGNFQQLHREGREHFGAQLCRRLNGGLGPDEVSRELGASEGA
jgi:hypothetical protein